MNSSKSKTIQTQNTGKISADLLKKIYRQIDEVRSNSYQLSSLHQRAITLDELNSETVNGEISELSTSTMNNILQTCSRIKALPPCPERKSLMNILIEASKEFQFLENKARATYNSQRVNLYKTIFPNATEEQVEHMIESPTERFYNEAHQAYEMNQFSVKCSAETLKMMRETEQRCDEIRRIEHALDDLLVVFEEMRNILEQQETAIHFIEQRGEKIEKDLDKGSAIVSTSSARKKKRFIFLILLCILAVIVGSIAYKIVNDKRE